MIGVFFVADGERDGTTIPRIVEGLLGFPVKETTGHWARLHHAAGRGYDRKLRFAVRQARDLSLQGLVATVDRDKHRDREKLKTMREARALERQASPPFPTALGEAIPHAEIWLLDDPVAVREALRLTAGASVVNVRKTANPKLALDLLIQESNRADDDPLLVLRDIATGLSPSRCVHSNETGFDGFAKDLRAEFQNIKPP